MPDTKEPSTPDAADAVKTIPDEGPVTHNFIVSPTAQAKLSRQFIFEMDQTAERMDLKIMVESQESSDTFVRRIHVKPCAQGILSRLPTTELHLEAQRMGLVFTIERRKFSCDTRLWKSQAAQSSLMRLPTGKSNCAFCQVILLTSFRGSLSALGIAACQSRFGNT